MREIRPFGFNRARDTRGENRLAMSLEVYQHTGMGTNGTLFLKKNVQHVFLLVFYRGKFLLFNRKYLFTLIKE